MESNVTRQFHSSNSISKNAGDDFFQLNEYNGQELYYAIAMFVINVFLCLTALFGNFASLVAIWKTPSLRSPGNALLASLALSDFAVGLISHPLFLARLSGEIFDISTFSHNLAVAFNISTTFLTSASLLTITAIGVDRLLALQLHLRYEIFVTQFRVCWVAISIWTYSAFFSSSLVWFTDLYVILLAPSLVTLLVVNFGIYVSIYLIVRRHQAQIQQQQHQQGEENNRNIFSIARFKKSAVNTFLVYILLLCCYFPFGAVSLVKGLRFYSSVYLDATGTIVLLNSSLNPLLYCWRVREMRTAIKHMLCR